MKKVLNNKREWLFAMWLFFFLFICAFGNDSTILNNRKELYGITGLKSEDFLLRNDSKIGDSIFLSLESENKYNYSKFLHGRMSLREMLSNLERHKGRGLLSVYEKGFSFKSNKKGLTSATQKCFSVRNVFILFICVGLLLIMFHDSKMIKRRRERFQKMENLFNCKVIRNLPMWIDEILTSRWQLYGLFNKRETNYYFGIELELRKKKCYLLEVAINVPSGYDSVKKYITVFIGELGNHAKFDFKINSRDRKKFLKKRSFENDALISIINDTQLIDFHSKDQLAKIFIENKDLTIEVKDNYCLFYVDYCFPHSVPLIEENDALVSFLKTCLELLDVLSVGELPSER